jgi:hypothetical protein
VCPLNGVLQFYLQLKVHARSMEVAKCVVSRRLGATTTPARGKTQQHGRRRRRPSDPSDQTNQKRLVVVLLREGRKEAAGHARRPVPSLFLVIRSPLLRALARLC